MRSLRAKDNCLVNTFLGTKDSNLVITILAIKEWSCSKFIYYNKWNFISIFTISAITLNTNWCVFLECLQGWDRHWNFLNCPITRSTEIHRVPKFLLNFHSTSSRSVLWSGSSTDWLPGSPYLPVRTDLPPIGRKILCQPMNDHGIILHLFLHRSRRSCSYLDISRSHIWWCAFSFSPNSRWTVHRHNWVVALGIPLHQWLPLKEITKHPEDSGGKS